MNDSIPRRGSTLIELLVVMAVIFLVIAMLAPAIQYSRAQARKATCDIYLRRITLAMHNHADVYNSFPPGWDAKVPTAGDAPRYGWQTFILAFMDYPSLASDIENLENKTAFEKPLPPGDFFHKRANRKIFQTEIDGYRCPSDATPAVNAMRGNYGTSNYSGVHGDVPLPRWTTGRQTAFWPGQADTPQKANGMLYWNSNIGFRDVTDGLAFTFMVGERSVTSAAGIWPGVGSNNFENDAVTDCSHASRLNAGPTSFSSGHSGGANFAMGDGSVHFISDKIESQPASAESPGTYQRLANRHDGLDPGKFGSYR